LGPDLDARVCEGEAGRLLGARPEVIAGGTRADDRAGPGISGGQGPAIGPEGQAVVHADRRGKIVRGVEAVLFADRRADHRHAWLRKPWPTVRVVIAYVGIPVMLAQRAPGEGVLEEDPAAASGGVRVIRSPRGDQPCCRGERRST